MRVRLVLEYDGTRFSGFQRQRDRPSIQETVEAVLSSVCGHPVEITGAGRTDAGVHAVGQVVHFDTMGSIPAGRIAEAVNPRLGPEIVVRHGAEAPLEFHARYSAVRRTYRYHLTRERPTPWLGRYVHYPGRLPADAGERMVEALPGLLGTRDFRALVSGEGEAPAEPGAEARSTVRTVFSAKVLEGESRLTIEVGADGFLRSMMRNLAALLLDVARRKREPAALEEALERGERPAALVTAPPHGLFLMRVEYPDGYPILNGFESDALDAVCRLAGGG